MQTKIYVSLAVICAAMLTSCSKMGALGPENFNVTPNPLVSEAGKVTATINGRFPEKYMKRNAVVTVTPVLRYAGGETVGQKATFQGEKIEANNQTISYRVGGNYTMKTTFDYVDAMHKSALYLVFDAKAGSKYFNVPDVKVADGVIATSELVKRTMRSANTSYAEDNYQHVIRQQQEANIQFLINQVKIRSGELKSVSVQQFINTLKDIRQDEERKALDNVQISSYASPEGSLELNKSLAEGRGKNTKELVNQELKNKGLTTNIDSKYTAEDWEGFQKLVGESNIQDKDLILRVLSMYTDPEERETQIRNISAAFTELTKEILPQLRRSRILVNYDLIGRSDDEIMAQYNADASKLSVDELLYAVTLTEDVQQQQAILEKTVSLYPKDYRAYNNLATIAYKKAQYHEAASYLAKALQANSNAPEANVNNGMLQLMQGNVASAEQFIAKGASAASINEAMGCLALMQGNYAQAIKNFGDTKSNSAALAQLVNKDYLGAATTLNAVGEPDAMTSYLKAIIAARTNNNQLAIDNLRSAISQDPSLASYAADDLEFTKLQSDAAFLLLTK